jgi:hypothetical protein
MTTTQTPIAAAEPQTAESIIIRPWPKVVFFYPSFVAACLAFLLSLLGVDARLLGNTFMLLFCLNVLVFSFDFSRIKSITIVISVIAIVLLGLWIDTRWDISFIGRLIGSIDIHMSTSYYATYAAFMGFVFLLVFVNSRFDYYEVNAREILHHNGYLGDITRWSTEGLEMNKEINDVVEYLLLRSGRLVFLPASSKKAIVLDNVAKVNLVEDRVNDLLSVVAVRMNQRPGPG